MKPRQKRQIKTPRPFRPKGCKVYYIRITGIDGQRKYINLSTSNKKEARIRANREIELINSQLDGHFTKVVDLIKLVDMYFDSKINLAPSTKKRNRQHIKFFLEFIKLKYPQVNYLQEITQIHISEFQIYRLNSSKQNGERISGKTARESMGVLNNLFVWAVNQGFVKENLVKRVEKIRLEYKEQRVFDEEEITNILNYCKKSKPYVYLVFLTLSLTGMRSGELTHLLWDDIDFERKVIKIRTKTLPDGREWRTKTRQRREILMDPELVKLLSSVKRSSKSCWVFINTEGRRYTEYTIWDHLIRICEKLKIKRGQVHSFRRSFACTMDKSVGDRVAIQQTLGHTTVTMTDRYCGYRPKEYVDKAHMKTTAEILKRLKKND